MKKEAIYIFKYRGVSATVNVFVDPVEKRRYWSSSSYILPLNNPLNYTGTGAEEVQTYEPEIVHEEQLPDFASYQRNMAQVLFKLPDVEAYAVGSYSELSEGPGPTIPEFSVTLIDKL
ncbi:hypothetical protein Goe27_00600 [Bacillus phage vB_BsuM-Goe27]|nr:hypothetical protein BSP12_058 [Bacillus phage BSP12]WCS68926.1 hypothetical protein Goe17_00630 [Bacillus phage vB_BsuM-Goe17]WCS69180.1 hypothetical protein Goe20_00590 [Bacillus phage vB_BsuM-Goe20]WCS69691.1 hypothetical protein Goe25_00590 [Bacillus phage vB_BsuM-Goe25]WCS69942.1 hypothetical protein Goe27_00600 [Bacillus phage vB_BsuM-Goe27]